MPVLVEHLHDYRLTRSIESTNDGRYTWHVRISDVVADLLDELRPEPFSYDFRDDEGRGKSLDRNHILHWWSQVQQTTALEYLRTNALTRDGNGRYTEHEHLLRLLADRDPEEFARLFERHAKYVKNPYQLLETLAASKVAEGVKAKLFLDMVESGDAYTRRLAVDHLLRLEHPQAVPLLVKELDGIPETPKKSYWSSSAASVAGMVCLTDNARAWAHLLTTAKRVDIGQRLQILEAIGNHSGRKDAKAIEFLAAFLGDAETRVTKKFKERTREREKSGAAASASDAFRVYLYDGFPAGYKFPRLAVRDYAATRLAEKMDLDERPDKSWKVADWARLHEKVRQALADRPRREASEERDRE